MRVLTVPVNQSTGRVLCTTIFRANGKRLLGKGHTLSEEDVQLLTAEGMQEVWVTELEAGEVAEDDAVLTVSREMVCGAVEIRPAPGGRVNVVATEDCCVLVDEHLLRQVNWPGVVSTATAANFGFRRANERVATIKSAPFAVPKTEIDSLLYLLAQRGPILQARPIRTPTVAALFSDPLNGERARQLFEGVLQQRLQKFGVSPALCLLTEESEEALCRSLRHLLMANPALVLIASTTAPAGPEDAVGRSLRRMGCSVERFLAPVDPGHLLLLAYKDNTPIVSAPCCFYSTRRNVVDLILPALLARYRISGEEIAGLGAGGLLG